MTFRIAEIAVPQPGDKPRGPHLHNGFEECIYVLRGTGVNRSESGEIPIKPGDIVLIPPNEKHMTVNTGSGAARAPVLLPGARRERRHRRNLRASRLTETSFACGRKPISRASTPCRRASLHACTYLAPDDPSLRGAHQGCDRALVIPAVGPKLPASLFEDSLVKLVQVTGAGLDRLDQAGMTRLSIPVANVPGNNAVAEYAVTAATALLRRFGLADAEIKRGNYAAVRARMIADNLSGLEGLLVGIVGFGVIGRRGGDGVPSRRLPHRVSRSGAPEPTGRGGDRRKAGRARRAAPERRHRQPARAAAARDHRPDRRARAQPDEVRPRF